MKMAIFYLTCGSEEEADEISQVLLQKNLIACAKKIPVTSSFIWRKSINETNEVLVLFESIEDNFDKVNDEVKKRHIYETYVLFSVPVSKTTKDVEKWLEKEIKQ